MFFNQHEAAWRKITNFVNKKIGNGKNMGGK